MGAHPENLEYYDVIWSNKYVSITRHKTSRSLSDHFDKKLYRDDLLVELKKLVPTAIAYDGDCDDNHITIADDCILVVGRFDRSHKAVNMYLYNPLMWKLKNTYNLPKMPEGNFGIERDLAQISKSIQSRLLIPSTAARDIVKEKYDKEQLTEGALVQYEMLLKQRFPQIQCTYDSARYSFQGYLKIGEIEQHYKTSGGDLYFEPRLSLTMEQTEEFFTMLSRWKRQNETGN